MIFPIFAIFKKKCSIRQKKIRHFSKKIFALPPFEHVCPVSSVLVLLALLILLMTKHRQLRCLPFPEEAVSLSLSRPWCSYIRRAFGPATYARPSAGKYVS